MPLYDFECANAHRFARYVKLAQFSDVQQCECGAFAERRIFTPPFANPDISGYTSPIDGSFIGSRKKRREDLRRNNCVEWEPGFRELCEKRRERENEAFEKAVDETVEKAIFEMPARKREKLAGEMEGGVTAEVVRG